MMYPNNNKKYFFEIHKDKDTFSYTNYNDRFYFNLKDEKGNIYLESDLYVLKTSCKKEIKSVLKNSKNEDRFRLIQTYDDKQIFFLRDETDEIIAESTDFDNEEEVIKFIKNLKNLSLKTPIVDKTK